MKCQECGTEIVKNSNNQKYCPKCAGKKHKEHIRKWNAQHKDKLSEYNRKRYKARKKPVEKKTIKCHDCGKEIVISNTNQKYCPECAKERHRRSNIKWRKNNPERFREIKRRSILRRRAEIQSCASSHNNCFSCPYLDCIKG